MIIRDKKLANAKPISSFTPGDIVTTCGKYFMLTDNNVGLQMNPGYRICVNVEDGAISIFNDDYLVNFAPSEVYVE